LLSEAPQIAKGLFHCGVDSTMNETWERDLPSPGQTLTDAQVVALAELALAGIQREYPNKPSNVLIGPQSVRSPKELHAAFYGCFDWHSAVHGHWMLIRLLRLYPDCSAAVRIRDQLGRHFSLANMQAEAAYFDERENRGFERMYGWAWALRLTAELHKWDDRDAQKWRDNVRPLEVQIAGLTNEYLPRLSHPIRTGVHPDTAFALSQTID
jgi:hypothetical protein